MSRPVRRAVVLACIGAACAIRLHGQAPVAAPSRNFEVASIKRNTSGSLMVNSSVAAGRYTGTNVSVEDLLAAIYAPIARSHISGPEWIRSERFDIVAKAEGTPSAREMFGMLHSLLIER